MVKLLVIFRNPLGYFLKSQFNDIFMQLMKVAENDIGRCHLRVS